MKKILLSVLALTFSAGLVFSQSLSLWDLEGNPVANGETRTFTHYEFNEISAPMHVKNEDTRALDVMAKKTEISIQDGAVCTFCWIGCYPPSTFVSPDPATIAGGDLFVDFHGALQPTDWSVGVPVGESDVLFTFYVDGNPNDSVSFIAHFERTTGLDQMTKDQIRFSDAYPNPSSQVANVNYELPSGVNNAQIAVYNLLGTKVQEINLNDKQGTAVIPVNELGNGIYFYSIVANNEVVATKKLIVNK